MSAVIRRRVGRLCGEAIPEGRVASVLGRLLVLVRRAGALVAMGALRVIVNGLPTSRRFAPAQSEVTTCGMLAFCPVFVGVSEGRRDWVRPGWLAGADMTTLFMLVPADEQMRVVHGVWLYVLCRAYNGVRNADGVAQSADAHRRTRAEFRALLSQRPALRRVLLVQHRCACVAGGVALRSACLVVAFVLVSPGPLGVASQWQNGASPPL